MFPRRHPFLSLDRCIVRLSGDISAREMVKATSFVWSHCVFFAWVLRAFKTSSRVLNVDLKIINDNAFSIWGKIFFHKTNGYTIGFNSRHFVGPDLGPNCLQMLSAATCRQQAPR